MKHKRIKLKGKLKGMMGTGCDIGYLNGNPIQLSMEMSSDLKAYALGEVNFSGSLT
jgi:hypothetical protein